MKSLENILSYRREHNSKGEQQFIQDYMSGLRPNL
jgi:hypothetical protein